MFGEGNCYLGPLGSCACKVSVSLAKRSNTEGFRTAGTSACPAKMDEALAQAMLEHLLLIASASMGQYGRHEKGKDTAERDQEGSCNSLVDNVQEAADKDQGEKDSSLGHKGVVKDQGEKGSSFLGRFGNKTQGWRHPNLSWRITRGNTG